MTKTKKRAVIMAALLAVFLLFAVFGRALAPNDPYTTDLLHSLEGPSARFPFGTDNLGRCILSRVLEGASASIFSALAVTAAVFAFGTAVGILAGYLGGAADQLLMKLTMIFQAFPGFILAVAVAGMLGPGLVGERQARLVDRTTYSWTLSQGGETVDVEHRYTPTVVYSLTPQNPTDTLVIENPGNYVLTLEADYNISGQSDGSTFSTTIPSGNVSCSASLFRFMMTVTKRFIVKAKP